MLTVNIHDAKTRLSALIAAAVEGEPFIIAKAGKPQVMVCAIAPPDTARPPRIGFMKGQIKVPADFDTMGSDEIAALFEGKD